MNSPSKEIVVVGGGLVGSLLAALLAERGFRVTVHERRPDFRTAQDGSGRSINLVLTRRGIDALARVGLDAAALRLTVPVTGRLMHPVSGELVYQPYGRDASECNYSISRSGLNEFLVVEAERRGVRFRFDSRLVAADLDARKWTFETGDGRRSVVHAPVVFGTDGAGSAVRAELQKRPGFRESIEMLGHGYKELEIPALDGGYRIERSALHIWPRGDFMLMALPNVDGSFTATLYLPYEGAHGFELVDTPPRVLALFEEFFPDAIALIPDLAESFLANPTGSLGTVRCSPWHDRDRALLLGDASHAIVPFFGQGMNSGFEDCAVLADLLESHGTGDWAGLFAEFDRLRVPNAEAIADMALENFDEMRDRVGDERFRLRKRVEHVLERELPRHYRSRYSMVMYSRIPYRQAQEAGRLQQDILDELCVGLATERDLDLDLAKRLIGERLTPWLAARSIGLDY